MASASGMPDYGSSAAIERWRHLDGCADFFNAVRETVSDRFLITYKAGEPRPDITSVKGGSE